MSLPYLCHFRFIVHIWNIEEDHGHEVLLLETSCDRFILRSKEKYEKDKAYLSKHSNDPQNIRIVAGMHDYLNEYSLRSEDYGKELLRDGDLITNIVYDDIKAEGDKYFEVSGTLHEYTSRDYWGEYDSDCEIENLRFQEVAEEDVNIYLKDTGNDE